MQAAEVPFADLLSDVVDNRGRTCPTAESGIPLIATNCIRNNLLYPAYEDVRYVSQEIYDTWFRGHPRPGDIIFVNKGTPGRVCLVPEPVDFCIAQDMVALRANDQKIYPRFLFALLRSQSVQERIEQLHVGTLIPHFKKGDFDKLLLPVPKDRSAQEFIGDTYFELSAKMELNRRMNETLEAIAQTEFRRMMEKGEPGTLGDIAESPKRGVDPGDIDPQTPYIGLEHMPRRCIALSEWGTAGELESGKARFQRGEILFGKLRPYFHKVGVAPLDGVCSTDILTIVPKKPAWFGLLLGHLSSKDLIDHTDACSTGTKMPRVSWSDIARYEIALPSEKVAGELTSKIQPLVERIIANIHESRTLAALRDALLPKLLSGAVRVRPEGMKAEG